MIAADISIAGATCGPGITVTPTRACGRAASVASAASRIGPRLPSRIRHGRRPSSTAARFSTDSGMRLLYGRQIWGFTRSTAGASAGCRGSGSDNMRAVFPDYLATVDVAGKRPLDVGEEILESDARAVGR